jgi:hypothetical protein
MSRTSRRNWLRGFARRTRICPLLGRIPEAAPSPTALPSRGTSAGRAGAATRKRTRQRGATRAPTRLRIRSGCDRGRHRHFRTVSVNVNAAMFSTEYMRKSPVEVTSLWTPRATSPACRGVGADPAVCVGRLPHGPPVSVDGAGGPVGWRRGAPSWSATVCGTSRYSRSGRRPAGPRRSWDDPCLVIPAWIARDGCPCAGDAPSNFDFRPIRTTSSMDIHFALPDPSRLCPSARALESSTRTGERGVQVRRQLAASRLHLVLAGYFVRSRRRCSISLPEGGKACVYLF